MYFKRLEMFGFKSFAEKTKIDFERGITAIVGPNGCGKSNIADSIKWVLGEQSAKAMRGSRMEDVIFNGTEQKEPLGYTEVSLVLSNEEKLLPIEYDEVTLSRRLYRSGESEYLINKNPVRLKDVSELLMGSGIGTEYYSMIEQGKIDQILSANPEERRIVFEEASGITKYKSKKAEAIRKLEYTEQNLLRVNDIIKEVQRQIGSIERQARKAERYKELFERLKSLDTGLAVCKYSKLKEKMDSFSGETGGIRDEEKALLDSVTALGREMEAMREDSDALEARISRYRLDRNEADMTRQLNRDRISLNKERLEELSRYQIEQRGEIESLQKRMDELTVNLEGVTETLKEISRNTQAKETLLSSKEGGLRSLREEIEKNQESAKQNRLKTVDILASQSRLRNEAAKIASDMQNISARIRRLNIEKEDVSKELQSLDKNLADAKVLVNEAIAKIETLENERINYQNSLKNEKESFAALEKGINDSKNNCFALHSKLNFLKDLLKRHEGFSGGTQELLNRLSDGQFNLGAFCEPLAELVEPKKGYEAACEAALAGNLQNLAVDDWNTAFAALEYLNKNDLGKASFIRNAPAGAPAQAAADNRPVPKNMASFVKCDPAHRGLFDHLLRDTYLVDTIEEGLSVIDGLPEDMRKAIRLVTPKGDIITKETITGGSAAKDFTSSVIGRQMRITETEEEIAQSEKELLALKQEANAKKEAIENLHSEVRKLEEMLRAEEINLAEKRSHEANLAKTKNKVNEELDLLALEIEEAVLDKNGLLNKEIELKSKLDECAKEEQHIQGLILDSQNFMEEGAKKREGLLVAIAQIQTELASLRKEEDSVLNDARSLKDYCEKQAPILNVKKESFEESFRRQGELAAEVQNLEADTACLEERLGVVDKELGILESENRQLKAAIKEKEALLSGKNSSLGAVKDKIHAAEIERTQKAFQMESLKNRMEQIYKVNLDEMVPAAGGMEDAEKIQAEVGALSRAVEKMGPVNLVAIDEHKELEERFAFLKHQEEDLAGAKDSLLKAIKKINQTTRSLFMETFTQIQAEFKNYFRFLFGGGRAEIVLLDENDVLESGIEIIVRPPGKKLQTISLLSGGEKALTATALLFAVFKVKPSPFCVLDEIDAPLDESNIGRFGKALQEFAKNSQFIIITHNKKTIGIADVMYGITMQESGVSRIISVKFSKKMTEEKEAVFNTDIHG